VDPEDLAQAGWGVIFAADADPEIRTALAKLLDLRRSQAAAVRPGRYRELAGPAGYQPGERYRTFLARHGTAASSTADPDVLPYYLLLVGGPNAIPFDFQYGLDITYAVGRLAFETPEEYSRYAAAAVAAESQARPKPELVFFGPRNADDRATALSVDHLVEPLAASIPGVLAAPWTVRQVVGPGQATKEALRGLLTGGATPALLMAAAHGLAFPSGHPLQHAAQGGLLCQEWPGPSAWQAAIPTDFYLAGDDLISPGGSEAGPAGMIALLYACFGAGTPAFDDYIREHGERPPMAPEPFVARLAQRMLAHPNGAALAVLGHVERTMSFSFVWPGAGEQLGAFRSTLTAIANGSRVGEAMHFLNDRHAALAAELDDERERLLADDTADPSALAGLWTARNDARNFVLLGDPAVRLTDPTMS
jgi:hypothetical protein